MGDITAPFNEMKTKRVHPINMKNSQSIERNEMNNSNNNIISYQLKR